MQISQLKHTFDTFTPSQEYLDTLPDIQNKEFNNNSPIDFVGIDNFHVPLFVKTKEGGTQEVMANITGMVSLEATKRGINMSRIIRTFMEHSSMVFDIDILQNILEDYRKKLESFDAHILMNFKYRIWQDALNSVKDDGSKEGGWQYYNVTFDTNLDHTGEFKKILTVDYVYSSACPCSSELTLHMEENRGYYGIPHSQRSIARISLDLNDYEEMWIEDVVDLCRKAIPTETQVFVKRIDEQRFAQLNGANPIFVEDAIRKLYDVFVNDKRVIDFKIICSHRESLHSHNAIAVITKGLSRSVFNHHVSLGEWNNMIC